MTLDEARTLVGGNREITIRRNHAKWTGIVTGVFTGPAIRLEQSNGEIVVVTLEGAERIEDS